MTRIGGVQPGGVGEQDQQPRPEQQRHLGGEEVVVAERDLVGRRRVVLVDHRHRAPLEQPAERLARVQVVHPDRRGRTRSAAPARRAPPRPPAAPRRRGTGSPGRPPTPPAARRSSAGAVGSSISRIPSAIAPEVTIATSSPPWCSSATCAQTLSSTCARSAPRVVGDDRGSELDDDGHWRRECRYGPRLSRGRARTPRRRSGPRRRARSRRARAPRSRRSRAAAARDRRAPRGWRGRGARPASRSRGR